MVIQARVVMPCDGAASGSLGVQTTGQTSLHGLWPRPTSLPYKDAPTCCVRQVSGTQLPGCFRDAERPDSPLRGVIACLCSGVLARPPARPSWSRSIFVCETGRWLTAVSLCDGV